jgi:hypothetical protein
MTTVLPLLQGTGGFAAWGLIASTAPAYWSLRLAYCLDHKLPTWPAAARLLLPSEEMLLKGKKYCLLA